MDKKILFIASVSSHIVAFHLPYIQWFKDNGYEVHVACKVDKELPMYIDKVFDLEFIRSPFSFRHYSSYVNLVRILQNTEYHVVSCHTPMASMLARIASRKSRKKGTKVVYMAHGFHFYKGGPYLNWLIYFPIEKFLTKLTDGIICINTEDFNIIRSKGYDHCNYHLVPGVGVDESRFSTSNHIEKINIRKRLQLNQDKFSLVYAGEFITRKNHKFIIETFNKYRNELSEVICYFAGKGEKEIEMKQLVSKYKLEKHIVFLGFRSDIQEVYKSCDVGVSSSFQEGLPINIVEEMLCGLPIVASIERGHNELVVEGKNGFMFEVGDGLKFVNSILTLKNSSEIYMQFSEESRIMGEKFGLNNSFQKLISVYKNYI